MEINKHRLIAGLSRNYADKMCDGNDAATFDRCSIAAAYIIGAEETLHRVCNIILESARIGGIDRANAAILLETIEAIESMPLQR